MTNAMRFGTAGTIGAIFNVIGVLFIGAANACLCYAFLHYVPEWKGLAQNWITPCVFAGFIGLVIGSMFMSVYSFASDTILQCYMVDDELDRPDGNRPAIMNQFVDAWQNEEKKD